MVWYYIFTLKIFSLILSFCIIFSLYRAIAGPTTADRIIGVNVIGTKVTVLMVFIAVILNEPLFIDIAIIYVLLLFITTLALIKYLGRKSLGD